MNLLFCFTFPSPLCQDARLYHRGGNFADGVLHVAQGDTCTFDTFFNCFSVDAYRRLTVLDAVAVRVRLQGAGTMRLCWTPLTAEIKQAFAAVDAYQDGFAKKEAAYPKVDLAAETVDAANFAFDEPQWVEITVPFARCQGEGMLFAQIEATAACRVYEGGYYTPAAAPKTPTVGVVICTYRREQYVLDNLARLRDFWRRYPQWKQGFGVYVVDNGNTLPLDIPSATVLPNRNLGGSGGFTRGIMQVEADGYSHVLLMDDDIAFDPWVLVKTYTLLQYAAYDKLSVGGSMMQKDKPSFQFEMGARWYRDRLYPCRRGYDVALAVDVLRNEGAKVPDYNAWWYMCMPTAYVRQYGLPLPLFIKGDDIEYGLRCCHRQIATLNGIGVWHENFQYKYSGELDYYSRRNELIVSALHAPLHPRYAAGKLIRGVAKELIFQRYKEADLLFDAYRDFLKGPQFLQSVDAEALHKALRLPFAQYSKQQLTDMGYDLERPYAQAAHASFLKKVVTLNGYLLPTCCFDKTERQQGRLVHLATATPKDMYKAPWSIQYSHETDRGFVTRLSRRAMWRNIFRLVPMVAKVLTKYRRVCRRWQQALPVLSGQEGWAQRLGLNKTTTE